MEITNYVTRLANMTDEEYARCCNMARAVFMSGSGCRSIDLEYILRSMFDSRDDNAFVPVLDELVAIKNSLRLSHEFLRLHSQLFLQSVKLTPSLIKAYHNLAYHVPSASLNISLTGAVHVLATFNSSFFQLDKMLSPNLRFERRILPTIIKQEYLVNPPSLSVADLKSDFRLLLREIIQLAELIGGEIVYE